MPITLTLRVMGQQSAPLTLDGSRIVLGRGASSDVRIPDPSVSHRHATIRAERSQYVLVDEGSVNGSWVGGVRLLPGAPRVLRRGDQIRLGRVWLEVQLDAAAPTADLAGATRDVAFALVAEAMQQFGDDTVPKVCVVEGRDVGEELRLEALGRSYVVGRGDDCDLVLSDADASRRHVLISRRGSQIWVQDLGSKNGVYLGEQRIAPGRDVPWRPQNMLRAAHTVLALDEPVQRALQAIEAHTEEPLSDEEQEALSQVLDAVEDAQEPAASVAPAADAVAEGGAPASAFDAAAAPIAELPPPLAPRPRSKRAALSTSDWVIVAVALGVFVLSAVALSYLLSG